MDPISDINEPTYRISCISPVRSLDPIIVDGLERAKMILKKMASIYKILTGSEIVKEGSDAIYFEDKAVIRMKEIKISVKKTEDYR